MSYGNLNRFDIGYLTVRENDMKAFGSTGREAGRGDWCKTWG